MGNIILHDQKRARATVRQCVYSLNRGETFAHPVADAHSSAVSVSRTSHLTSGRKGESNFFFAFMSCRFAHKSHKSKQRATQHFT